MQLTLWTYEGPPHIGAMRLASSMQGVHYVLHAPQGDTYADLLFTMIQRDQKRPPVTYTTFQARDLGGDTAELFKVTTAQAVARFKPEALLVGASCTAELIQDDPGGLASTLGLSIPVIPLELPAYQRKENWGLAESFYRVVRALGPKRTTGHPQAKTTPSDQPSCNILGPSALGFRHRDDLIEVKKLIESLGVRINVIAPWQASPSDLAKLGQADFNVVMYKEVAQSTAEFLKRELGQPFTSAIPMGVQGTLAFMREIAEFAGIQNPNQVIQEALKGNRSRWYAESVDSNYLTDKRVFIFGDATHVLGAARVAKEELGFQIAGVGTYSREFARDIRELAQSLGVEALITDDYIDVEQRIIDLQPELVLGTQMERHVAKRLGIPCTVISAPVHVQDFPARHSPQFGFEGANVLFDTWVHPLMMGLEEHLLRMFSDDFEFHETQGASHLGHAGRSDTASEVNDQPSEPPTCASVDSPNVPSQLSQAGVSGAIAANESRWTSQAEAELKKIPFFVRGKARRNTETYARERGIQIIELDTLYDAKAFYSR